MEAFSRCRETAFCRVPGSPMMCNARDHAVIMTGQLHRREGSSSLAERWTRKPLQMPKELAIASLSSRRQSPWCRFAANSWSWLGFARNRHGAPHVPWLLKIILHAEQRRGVASLVKSPACNTGHQAPPTFTSRRHERRRFDEKCSRRVEGMQFL
jgi:hypothetical protein